MAPKSENIVAATRQGRYSGSTTSRIGTIDTGGMSGRTLMIAWRTAGSTTDGSVLTPTTMLAGRFTPMTCCASGK